MKSSRVAWIGIGCLLAASGAFAADVLVENFNGSYAPGPDGVEQDWDIALPNGGWWEDTTHVTSPPRSQKWSIQPGFSVLPGDTGIWYHGGYSRCNLRAFAPNMDATKPWSLTCNVKGHSDRAVDEPQSYLYCEFEVLDLSNAQNIKRNLVQWTNANNETWQQLTYSTDGSTSGDTVITLVLAIHWGPRAEPQTTESFVVFDDIYLTYTPSSGDGTPPGPVTALTAKRWDGKLELIWQNPSDGDFAGTVIRVRTDHFPVSKTDGQLVADLPGSPGSAQTFTHQPLQNGTTYYYAAYAHDGAGNYAAGTTLATSPHPGLASSPLPVGWNLLGITRETPVRLQDCRLRNGSTTLTFTDAAAAGWVLPLLYYYDSGYKIVRISGGHDDSLRPWRGYWMLTLQDSVSLIVPPP